MPGWVRFSSTFSPYPTPRPALPFSGRTDIPAFFLFWLASTTRAGDVAILILFSILKRLFTESCGLATPSVSAVPSHLPNASLACWLFASAGERQRGGRLCCLLSPPKGSLLEGTEAPGKGSSGAFSAKVGRQPLLLARAA